MIFARRRQRASAPEFLHVYASLLIADSVDVEVRCLTLAAFIVYCLRWLRAAAASFFFHELFLRKVRHEDAATGDADIAAASAGHAMMLLLLPYVFMSV